MDEGRIWVTSNGGGEWSVWTDGYKGKRTYVGVVRRVRSISRSGVHHFWLGYLPGRRMIGGEYARRRDAAAALVNSV